VAVVLFLLRLDVEMSAVVPDEKFSKLKLFSLSITRSQIFLVFGLLERDQTVIITRRTAMCLFAHLVLAVLECILFVFSLNSTIFQSFDQSSMKPFELLWEASRSKFSFLVSSILLLTGNFVTTDL
jgi:hypothetical protein